MELNTNKILDRYIELLNEASKEMVELNRRIRKKSRGGQAVPSLQKIMCHVNQKIELIQKKISMEAISIEWIEALDEKED